MPETTTSPNGMSLRERAITEAEKSDRLDREHAAKQADERRRRIIDFAATTAIKILGEAAHGATWELVEGAEDDPYDNDRATVTIGGERFEFSLDQRAPRSLTHLVRCPSSLHPPADMRSADLISSLYDLGELLRSPDGRYRCLECSRVEHERAEAEVTAYPEPPTPTEALPTRDEALRKAVEFAERAYDYEGDDRAERLIAITAYATLSQAWSAVARSLQQDCLTYQVGD